MKAFLILEDGTVFTGTSIGSTKDVISEIVFNTSMTGYLEVQMCIRDRICAILTIKYAVLCRQMKNKEQTYEKSVIKIKWRSPCRG